MLVCKLCGNIFEPLNKRKREYCYECSPSFHKKNKKEYIHRQAAFRRALKKFGVNYLGGRCSKCGYDKCIGALVFHHKNPEEKEYSFGSSTMSFKTYLRELDKCELLCANCHSELH